MRNVEDAIVRRRATRRFDPERPLADDVLEEILHLATFAPSGYNLQPWRFIVVRSARNRERLRACAFGQPKVAEAPVVLIVLGYHHPHRTHLGPILAEGVRLGAFPETVAAGIRGAATAAMERVEDSPVWAMRSTMLAAATLLIAAESMGVASAPMEGFDPEKVRAAFGVPDDHTVCCLIALGYPASTEPFPGRFGLASVCFEEHFGRPWTLGEAGESGGPALDSDPLVP
jgi:nitroreductase